MFLGRQITCASGTTPGRQMKACEKANTFAFYFLIRIARKPDTILTTAMSITPEVKP